MIQAMIALTSLLIALLSIVQDLSPSAPPPGCASMEVADMIKSMQGWMPRVPRLMTFEFWC